MTYYGRMVQRAHDGQACVDAMGLDQGHILPGPQGPTNEIRVRPGRDGLTWVGRIWDSIDQTWYWVPLPYTTLADWETVNQGLRELGLEPTLDQ